MEHLMKDHIEIERKFIIAKPDLVLLQTQLEYTSSDIVQIYLKSSPHVTHRVRSRAYLGRTVYTETKKMRISGMSAYEDEHEITESEFTSLSENIDPDTAPIIKTRHTFLYHGQLFEVDVYPNWRTCAIMETELEGEDAIVDMPPFISIIKEVTGIKAYSNASMSRVFPSEIIE